MSSNSVYCHSSIFFYCTKHLNHWMRVLVFSGLLQFARSLDFSSITTWPELSNATATSVVRYGELLGLPKDKRAMPPSFGPACLVEAKTAIAAYSRIQCQPGAGSADYAVGTMYKPDSTFWKSTLRAPMAKSGTVMNSVAQPLTAMGWMGKEDGHQTISPEEIVFF